MDLNTLQEISTQLSQSIPSRNAFDISLVGYVKSMYFLPMTIFLGVFLLLPALLMQDSQRDDIDVKRYLSTYLVMFAIGSLLAASICSYIDRPMNQEWLQKNKSQYDLASKWLGCTREAPIGMVDVEDVVHSLNKDIHQIQKLKTILAASKGNESNLTSMFMKDRSMLAALAEK